MSNVKPIIPMAKPYGPLVKVVSKYDLEHGAWLEVRVRRADVTPGGGSDPFPTTSYRWETVAYFEERKHKNFDELADARAKQERAKIMEGEA